MTWKLEDVVTVCEHGTISPTFILPDTGYTSGFLKYFFAIANKRVKITIELLEEDQ